VNAGFVKQLIELEGNMTRRRSTVEVNILKTKTKIIFRNSQNAAKGNMTRRRSPVEVNILKTQKKSYSEILKSQKFSTVNKALLRNS